MVLNIYLLAIGHQDTYDCDEYVGVFTDVDKLKSAYNRLLKIRQQEIVDWKREVKIFVFPYINQLIDDFDYILEIMNRVEPEKLGLLSTTT